MKAIFTLILIAVALLFAVLIVSLMGGCSYDMYHHRDGSPKFPLATDKDDEIRPVEMPQPKGQ